MWAPEGDAFVQTLRLRSGMCAPQAVRALPATPALFTDMNKDSERHSAGQQACWWPTAAIHVEPASFRLRLAALKLQGSWEMGFFVGGQGQPISGAGQHTLSLLEQALPYFPGVFPGPSQHGVGHEVPVQ